MSKHWILIVGSEALASHESGEAKASLPKLNIQFPDDVSFSVNIHSFVSVRILSSLAEELSHSCWCN